MRGVHQPDEFDQFSNQIERRPVLDFYTAGTPNGYKVAIMLEECGLAYTPRYLDLGALEQKQDWFTAINPNGRVPAG